MSIIGISGQIGSGKDTVGKMIQYLQCYNTGEITIEDVLNNPEHEWWVEEQSKWEIKKFAGKLKQIASLLTGIPVEKFEDQEFKKTFLSKEWNSPYNIPFSGPDFVKHDGEMTVREFLQKLGTEAMRDGLHTNVWVNALFADYKEVWKDPDPIPDNDYTITWRENYTEDTTLIHYGEGSEAEVFDYEIVSPNWIITDMRFPNEMEAVKERKGITIRVVRPHGYINPHTGVYKEMPLSYHSSETALDESEFDYEILNDGTIADLVEKVKEILIKENII